MDAVEFFKTAIRLCKNQSGCEGCPIRKNGMCMAGCGVVSVENIEEAVSKVEQWAKGHPVKTRQDEFLKMFPNAKIDDDGVIVLCPRTFLPFLPEPEEVETSAYCEKHENCEACRKEYWLTEVTDNGNVY